MPVPARCRVKVVLRHTSYRHKCTYLNNLWLWTDLCITVSRCAMRLWKVGHVQQSVRRMAQSVTLKEFLRKWVGFWTPHWTQGFLVWLFLKTAMRFFCFTSCCSARWSMQIYRHLVWIMCCLNLGNMLNISGFYLTFANKNHAKENGTVQKIMSFHSTNRWVHEAVTGLL